MIFLGLSPSLFFLWGFSLVFPRSEVLSQITTQPRPCRAELSGGGSLCLVGCAPCAPSFLQHWDAVGWCWHHQACSAKLLQDPLFPCCACAGDFSGEEWCGFIFPIGTHSVGFIEFSQ